MKKTVLILILLTGVILENQAQHFTASFGVQHSWGVPNYVSSVVTTNYHDYRWVHASRIQRSGSLYFDVILQRGDVFVEVSVRNDGYISRRVLHDYYPLHDHVCNSYCGYHNNYYQTYYNSCQGHSHHGHNHVVYKKKPKGHAYGYYNNHPHHVNYTRVHERHDDHHEYDTYNRNHHDRNDYTRTRRDRYFDTKEYDRRKEYDRGEGYGRGKGHDREKGHHKHEHKTDKEKRSGEHKKRSRNASYVYRTSR